MMKRRSFISLTALSAMAVSCNSDSKSSATESNPQAEKQNPLKMYVGTQRRPTNPKMLQYIKRHGVNNICGYPPNPGERGYWTVEELEQTRELCEQHGITLDMVALPFMASSHIDREKRGAIVMGKSPERDRDIEHINIMTANMAKVGIPAFKYNLSLLGVLRTERTPGRGGATYSTWRLSEAKEEPALTRAGIVTAEMAWERIAYFLERVIPVCEEYNIRAACHPHDPGVPPEGYQGVDRVLGTVEGLKKFESIQESPYHGFNLCLGTTAEMLQNPNEEIHDVIRYFGQKKKIFNIHFRNIKGKRDDFHETYLDNGDMDMLEVLKTLAEVDYEYMVMPDHVPLHADDPGGLQAFAYSFGYIKALMAALEA